LYLCNSDKPSALEKQMKTTIYYFTATGNSFYTARLLADGVGDSTLIPIVKTLNSGESVTGERIILVFPVYMYRAPKIVCRFAAKIKKAASICAVVTMGGESGTTFNQLRSILRKNSLDLHAAFRVKMPDNFFTAYENAVPDDKQKKKLDEASGRITEVVNHIKNGDHIIEKDTSFLKTWIWPGIWFAAGYYSIPWLAKKSFVVEQSCNGCGTCAEVCPVGNIIMTDGKPVWSDHCELCLACRHWCPCKAIHFGKTNKGRRTQYRNPFVTVKDVLGQK
jgi:ferredoxin